MLLPSSWTEPLPSAWRDAQQLSLAVICVFWSWLCVSRRTTCKTVFKWKRWRWGCYRTSLLCSLPNRPMTPRDERGSGKEETLIGEPADLEDGRLVPQNNPLTEVWVPGSLLQIRDGGVGEEAQWKGHLSCKHLLEWQASGRGCVNFILPAICRWTGFWTKAL